MYTYMYTYMYVYTYAYIYMHKKREREGVYVLRYMFVTFPTCQVERSPLKATAPENTAPQQQQRTVQR